MIARSLALFLTVAVLHFALSFAGIWVSLPAAFEGQAGFWAAPGKILLVWIAAVLMAPLSWATPLLPRGADLDLSMIALLSVLFGAAAVGLFHLWRALRARKTLVQ